MGVAMTALGSLMRSGRNCRRMKASQSSLKKDGLVFSVRILMRVRRMRMTLMRMRRIIEAVTLESALHTCFQPKSCDISTRLHMYILCKFYLRRLRVAHLIVRMYSTLFLHCATSACNAGIFDAA